MHEIFSPYKEESVENFKKLVEDIDALDINSALSEGELTLLFVEQVCELQDLPDPLKMLLVALLANRIWLVRPKLGDKLREVTAVLSNSCVFELETHNPPSLAEDSGIRLQLGERGEFYHTPLEDMLHRLASTPVAGLGGVVRDISGPIDYGNEMRVGQRTPPDISEERNFLLSVLKEE